LARVRSAYDSFGPGGFPTSAGGGSGTRIQGSGPQPPRRYRPLLFASDWRMAVKAFPCLPVYITAPYSPGLRTRFVMDDFTKGGKNEPRKISAQPIPGEDAWGLTPDPRTLIPRLLQLAPQADSRVIYDSVTQGIGGRYGDGS